MKDRPTRFVPLGFYVDALDEVVDDARLLGWRRSVEAAGETIEELGEAEAACVAGIESPGPRSTLSSSNAYVVVTVGLSAIFLRQPLTRARGGAIALVLLGITQLALSAG
jgi:hypothetical protein